ncbi:hypothetical protein [Bradyrhizobium sp. BR 10289]|uniref:hypothetical protein n=1 Tax=Bradyrhizobium sp. BR 10289 TaxID=2749993 RepID=UPI001C6488D0|nr:hypothetical protein [Bradyrhizobium sp. BR 10289]MBW7970940.1 hypothetical protein [Bradyrhizobium sp. BR 10289]
MAKRKPFKASNVYIRREQQAHARMMHVRSPSIDMMRDPQSKPVHQRAYYDHLRPDEVRANTRARDLILYAAALGRKRGVLPEACSDWMGRVQSNDGSKARVFFSHEDGRGVGVDVQWLDWVPADPVEETELTLAA